MPFERERREGNGWYVEATGGVRVVAVIPVYRPPADFSDRVKELRTQVDDVVLVDDGSGTLPLAALDDVHILQISLPENAGIATALNAGMVVAEERGATHLLTLDQDSTVPPGYVELLVRAADRAGSPLTVAVPASAGGAAVLRDVDGTPAPFDPIQSGQLLTAEVWHRVGPFDESLFIDAVDSDFWFRALQTGISFVVVPEAHIDHGLGELRPIRILGRHLTLGGRPRHVLYHSPFRTYYMVRNSYVMHRRYVHAHRARLIKRDWKMFEMVFGCLLLSDDRGLQWRAIRAGLRDARRGSLGKIPAAVTRSIAPGAVGAERA